ncbi:MAG: phospholipid/cholesterol/gamma-HCH transport system substrate-binding protein [Candidatus Sumerlaeota bacterium]|nr:phospholipid/cholesterol/gamma-HCH transport system substrate-binding protein [Candidatus Sumerlaeota bacterium]
MSQRANYAKLGLFVLAGTALLIGGLIIYGAGELLEDGIPVETYLDHSAQGLSVGSPIKYRGVEVGRVTEISLVGRHYPFADEDYKRYVLIRGDLDATMFEGGEDDVETIIKSQLDSGLRVRMAAQGITGLAFMEIDYLDPERFEPLTINWQPSRIYLPSAPSRMVEISASIEKVAAGLRDSNIQAIAEDLRALLQTVTTTVEQARVSEVTGEAKDLLTDVRSTNARIKELIDNPSLETIPQSVANATERADKLIADSEQDLRVLIDEARGAAADMRAAAAKVNTALDDPRVESGLSDFSEVAANSREVSGQLPATVARLDRTLQRLELLLASQQEDVQAILSNMRQITDNLADTTETTRQYPSLLLFGDPPPPPPKGNNE